MPKEFTVVTEFTRTEFIKSVNQSLEDGWELYGNMVAMLDGYKKPVYMQTMTLTLGESNESHS